MKKIVFIALLFLVISTVAESQQKVKIDKNDFKVDIPGSEAAWYHIKEGDKCYEKGGGLYPEAAEHYLKAYKFNTESAALNYKLGVSSLFGNDQQGALPYFLKARTIDLEVSEDLILLTGRAYQFRGDFGKAVDCYNMYSDKAIENGTLNPIVNNYIRECNLAIESAGTENRRVEITNLGGSVNSSDDDYSPVLTRDEQAMYYTTRRQIFEKENLQSSDSKWNENIFIVTTNGDEWSDSGPAGKDLATEMNEGVLYVNNKNSLMLIYAGWIGNGDIMVSMFDRGRWTTPEPFREETSTPYRETSVVLTPAGDEMFFTSDRRNGNLGGRDIYYMRRVKNKKWTRPFNLGPNVNSDGNEEAVWASVTGDTIWFSSNGRTGFGGYDIYMAVRDDKGSYSEAVNLGMPVNSQWNDLFYRPSRIDRRKAWFSSNRPGGRGGLDIYNVKILPSLILETDSLNRDYGPR